ncbi:MAG: hypothetical protein IPK53_08980 [bacterium]|nr:hypothetical protein [bacterium]
MQVLEKALWVRFNPSVLSGVMQLGEKMGLLFRDWLTDQRDRQDGIGDLARNFALEDVTKKLSGRKSDEHKSWADAVIKSDILGIFMRLMMPGKNFAGGSKLILRQTSNNDWLFELMWRNGRFPLGINKLIG